MTTSVFDVHGTLNIINSSSATSSIAHSSGYENGSCALIYVDSGGTLNIGGTGSKGQIWLKGNQSQYGGGVYVDGTGTFNMYGGVIWKNLVLSTASGVGKDGGICVDGTTTMTGGYIINNTMNRNAAYGGVGIFGNCTFNMPGGIIWGNKHNGGTAISGVGTDDHGIYSKTGGLVDPTIDLTLENPLAPIVHITMKEDITLTDVRSEDGTVLTTADTLDFVGNQNVTWDLNGHTLDLNNYQYILADAGATFTLKDSGEGGNIINGNAGYYYGSSGLGYSVAWRNWGGAVYVRGGTFNMESGIIENCEIRHYGGAVGVWKGTFNMSGGIIRNCKINNTNGCGGGVCINTNAVFNMSGDALIENCYSATYGGGVLINGNSTMTMSDHATIKDCTAASYGGGVMADSTFNMTGGTITGCTAGTHSGGVFVNNGRTFNMTGGVITGCTAGTTGGGVDTNGVFNMTNGIIENCVSMGGDLGAGGGVFVWSSGSFTMTDSIIRNCKATSTAEKMGVGGAVHSYGPFTMKGNSLIYGNESQCATVDAPGVSLNGGVFNLQGGIVYGNWNTADKVRAGLYLGTGTLNQTGGYIAPKTVITLDPNGGSSGTASVTVYYGDTVMPVILDLPARENAAFNGFYDKDGDGTQYYDGSGVGATSWEKLDETITLYAYWIEKIAVPTAIGNLSYSGEERTGVPDGIGYIVTGNTGIAVGEYTATATPAEGYMWLDGSTEAKTIAWEILSVERYHYVTGTCDTNGGDGGLMGRQEKVTQDVTDKVIGRTIIPLTQVEIESIDAKIIVVASDGVKDFTVEIDCAYTWFYDGGVKISAAGMKNAEGKDVAAFLIVDHDGLNESITGYGYYRVYCDKVDDKDNLILDALYKVPKA